MDKLSLKILGWHLRNSHYTSLPNRVCRVCNHRRQTNQQINNLTLNHNPNSKSLLTNHNHRISMMMMINYNSLLNSPKNTNDFIIITLIYSYPFDGMFQYLHNFTLLWTFLYGVHVLPTSNEGKGHKNTLYPNIWSQ
jgi:hypothetical protein